MSAGGVKEAIQEETRKKSTREIEERYVVVMQDSGSTWRVMDVEERRFMSSSYNKRDAEIITEALNRAKEVINA